MDSILDDVSIDTLLDVARRTDDIGVVSVYADVSTPAERERTRIDVSNRFRELRGRIAAEGDTRSTEIVAGLDRIEPQIAELTDLVESGRGRILFAALGGPWSIRLSGMMPVANRVVLDDGPFVHPMLEMLDEGRPAGVVQVTANEVGVHEWRLGRLRALSRMQAPEREASHERAGHIGGGPSGQFNSPVREQRDARQRELAERFLATAANTVAEFVDERRWEQILLSGDARWTTLVADRLPTKLADMTHQDSRLLSSLQGAELASAVTDRLHEAHVAREQRLAASVEQAAHASRGVLGASEVAGALTVGKVAHLIYDPAVRYTGSVGSDGALYAGDERGMGSSDAVDEPRLTERLVERALATGARVTPIEGAAQGVLREANGIAALIRW
jgi:hypothetical protein